MENLELPGKHQEIKSSQIIIFDPSFDEDYGFEFAHGQIYGIIKNNIKRSKDLHLFFGISERLNWHVMENAKTFRWPMETLHPIQIPNRPDIPAKYKDNAIGLVTKFLGELIYTHPEKVIVFRDNNVSDIGHILIDKCLAQNIPVVSYNSLGNITPVNNINTDNPQKYYKVRHHNNTAIGETEELPR